MFVLYIISQEKLQAQLKQLTEEQNKYEAVLKDLSQKEQELKSCQEELKQCHKLYVISNYTIITNSNNSMHVTRVISHNMLSWVWGRVITWALGEVKTRVIND